MYRDEYFVQVSQCTLGYGHDIHSLVVLPVTDHDLFSEIIAIILSYYVLVFIHPLRNVVHHKNRSIGKGCIHRATETFQMAFNKSISMHQKGSSLCGYTSLLR